MGVSGAFAECGEGAAVEVGGLVGVEGEEGAVDARYGGEAVEVRGGGETVGFGETGEVVGEGGEGGGDEWGGVGGGGEVFMEDRGGEVGEVGGRAGGVCEGERDPGDFVGAEVDVEEEDLAAETHGRHFRGAFFVELESVSGQLWPARRATGTHPIRFASRSTPSSEMRPGRRASSRRISSSSRFLVSSAGIPGMIVGMPRPALMPGVIPAPGVMPTPMPIAARASGVEKLAWSGAGERCLLRRCWAAGEAPRSAGEKVKAAPRDPGVIPVIFGVVIVWRGGGGGLYIMGGEYMGEWIYGGAGG